MSNKIGILLTNTGTPDAPTTAAVRQYLREFLSDKRIVQLPKIIWLPILYGLVLTTRPQKSAKLYQKIWGKDSPMREYMEQIASKLSEELTLPVALGMNYGNPSIKYALNTLSAQNVTDIIVLPLFPQYSDSTTAASLDKITEKVTPIKTYAAHAAYINALANSVRKAWSQGEPKHLLISFHGIPQRFVINGDPYQAQCELTATLLAQTLQLPDEQWTLCYQSQFGYAKWLQPGTFDVLAQLPPKGIKEVDIICPGFAVDCLETLEEIAIRGKEVFELAGGETLRYIPALNDSKDHIIALKEILTPQIRHLK